MKPLNLNNQSCNPISSNCVIWQGPDLECISLCKGDTVTDVVYKMATELCTLMEITNLTSYDLTCLNLQNCNPSDFQGLIQLIINNLCANGAADNARESGNLSGGCPDCVVNIASCFYYTNEFGDQITTMQLYDYARTIGNKVCDIVNEITNINLILSNHETRITTLENEPAPVVVFPQVTPTCVLPSIPSTLQAVLSAVEQQFCELRSSTGLATQIYSSISTQCVNLNASPTLGTAGSTMSSLPGWIISPTNLADTINNLWLTICDLRAAVRTIQLTCCPAGCDGVEINITATFDGTFLRIYLTGSLPAGFLDCDGAGNLFTISDTTGASISQRISISSTINASPSATFNLSGSVLNLGSDFNIHTDACVRNASTNALCTICIDYILDNTTTCPTLVVSTLTDTTVDYSFNVVNPGTYTVQLLDSTGTTVLNQNAVVVLIAGAVTGQFTGLTTSTNYRLRLIVTAGTTTTECPFVPITTLPVVCTAPTAVTGVIELPVECENCGEAIDFVSNPSVEGWYADDVSNVLRYYDGVSFLDLVTLDTQFSVPGTGYLDVNQRKMVAVNNPLSAYNGYVFIMNNSNDTILAYVGSTLMATISGITYVNPPDPVTTNIGLMGITYDVSEDKIYYTHSVGFSSYLGTIDLANGLAVDKAALAMPSVACPNFISYSPVTHKKYIGNGCGIRSIVVVSTNPTPMIDVVVDPATYPGQLTGWLGAQIVYHNTFNGDVYIPQTFGGTTAQELVILHPDLSLTLVSLGDPNYVSSGGFCFYDGNGVPANSRLFQGFYNVPGVQYHILEFNADTLAYIGVFATGYAIRPTMTWSVIYNKLFAQSGANIIIYELGGDPPIQLYVGPFNSTYLQEVLLTNSIYVTSLGAAPANNTYILETDTTNNITCSENIVDMYLTVGPNETGPYVYDLAWESACTYDIVDGGPTFTVTAIFPGVTILGALMTYSINGGLTWLALGTNKTAVEFSAGVLYTKVDIPGPSYRLRIVFLTDDNCGLASSINDDYLIP